MVEPAGRAELGAVTMTVGLERVSIRNPDLAGFCRDRLSPLARSDQRRWGEVYVRGLVTVPGRKSIRRICDSVVGVRADQCLQQFVNQSTWQWEPVRRNLAEHVTAMIAPKAWVVRDVVFPKNGANSVGVASQYVPAAGRTLNCQIGLTVVLASDSAAFPVNWRLLLPRCWDGDQRRRDRAYLPATQAHRPRWQVMLEAVEEMRHAWGLAPVPVVADVADQRDVEPLLRGLEKRGLGYVLRVGQQVPAWRSRVCTNRPRATWLTNMNPARLPYLVELVKLDGLAAAHLARMQDDVGLRHFEGRSFRGWHHHVTLASIAHAYRLTSEKVLCGQTNA
jgi:SRSO17 transposase